MKFSKGFFSFFCMTFLAFASYAQESTRERVSLGYVWNPANEFSAVDFKLATPPLIMKKTFLTAGFNLREADLKLNKISSDIHLKNYRVGLTVASRLSEHWSFLAGPGISVRNASHSFILNHDTLYASLFALAIYKPTDAKGWSYALGFIYSHEIEKHQFLPAIGAGYNSPPLKIELGFPSLGIYYQPRETFEIGLRGNFDSSTYTLPDTSNLRVNDAQGLRIRIFDIGPVANFQIYKNIWLNTNLGVVALAEAHAVSAKGTAKKLLYRSDNPIFLRVALSYH